MKIKFVYEVFLRGLKTIHYKANIIGIYALLTSIFLGISLMLFSSLLYK